MSEYAHEAVSYGVLLPILAALLGMVLWLHTALEKRIERVEARLDRVEQRLDLLSKAVSDLRTEVRAQRESTDRQLAEIKELIQARKP